MKRKGMQPITRLMILSLLGVCLSTVVAADTALAADRGVAADPGVDANEAPAVTGRTQHATHVLGNRILVNCDRGQRLSRALRWARANTKIFVKGICREQVKITKDGIQLRGVRDAVIDGDIGRTLHEGVVTVDGARNVVVRDLEVRGGPDQGIVVAGGASAMLANLDVHDHQTVGVTVDASYVELSDINAHENRTGFDFFTGATVIATGPLTASDNAGAGFEVNAQSRLELRGSIVETANNGGDGMTIVNDALLVILSFPESVGSGVVAKNNAGAAGIFVANSSVSVVGSNFTGSGANVFDISGHGVGMLFIAANLSEPFATAQFNVASNGVGMLFTDSSDAFIVGGLNVSGNQIGILGDGAGVLRLQQDADNPSEITNNRELDVLMSFGSRIDLRPDVTVGSFVCDGSVITPREGTPCP